VTEAAQILTSTVPWDWQFSAVWKSSAKQPAVFLLQSDGRHANIPWAQIIAMRNRLIHGYDIVDYDIVWSTVSEDLPPLIAELEKILSPGR
jgi:Ribonuclease HepT-like